MSASVREIAAEYAALGFDPIPLLAGEKLPACAGWPKLPAPLQWAEVGDRANVGLRAGNGIAFVDCDSPQTFDNVSRWLASLGYYVGDHDAPVVVTPSGGRHVYVSFRGNLAGSWRRLKSDVGAGEFRFGSASYVVAPPSTVDGRQYTMTAGDLRQLPRLDAADVAPILAHPDPDPDPDPVAAILATATTARGETTARISAKTWRLLRGEGVDAYPTRSEAEAAIVAALVDVGLSFDAILSLFLRYPAAGKFHELREKDHRAAVSWLRRTWEKARKWAETHVSEDKRKAFYAVIAIQSRPWPGRTGRTDRAAALEHALTAYACAKLEYHLSERDLAERIGVERATARKANIRLLKAGLIERVKPTDGANFATMWRVRDIVDPYPHSTGCEGMGQLCPSPAQLPRYSHDAFRYRALGKTAAEILSLLEQRPMTAAELAERSGRTGRTVRRNLAKLARIVDNVTGEVFKLVERAGGDTWRACEVTDADLDAIARALGTAGAGERQRKRHERERLARRLQIEYERARGSSTQPCL